MRACMRATRTRSRACTWCACATSTGSPTTAPASPSTTPRRPSSPWTWTGRFPSRAGVAGGREGRTTRGPPSQHGHRHACRRGDALRRAHGGRPGTRLHPIEQRRHSHRAHSGPLKPAVAPRCRCGGVLTFWCLDSQRARHGSARPEPPSAPALTPARPRGPSEWFHTLFHTIHSLWKVTGHERTDFDQPGTHTCRPNREHTTLTYKVTQNSQTGTE